MKIIGIDPGITGAIATLTSTKATVEALPTFKVNKKRLEIDTKALLKLLKGSDLVIVEEVNAHPGWGAPQSFRFGVTCGRILSTVELSGIPLITVRPQSWKATVLKGTDKSKEAAITLIQRRFPSLTLIPQGKRTPSHDWAEAVCLALYGRVRA